jgi:hypothetical protein
MPLMSKEEREPKRTWPCPSMMPPPVTTTLLRFCACRNEPYCHAPGTSLPEPYEGHAGITKEMELERAARSSLQGQCELLGKAKSVAPGEITKVELEVKLKGPDKKL